MTQRVGLLLLVTCAASALSHYVTQKQDHFDSGNPRTWQQAFFVNDTYFVPGSDAPVFLCIGGEGPLYGDAVVNSVHCNIAVEFMKHNRAIMFAVEHRYYGCHNSSACPVSDPETELQYLSSQQALADLATFHAHATTQFSLTTKNKWVAFGGSYPGMLTAFVRAQYPTLIHAAVASSAPVHAMLDMHVFNDIGAAAYSVEYVGGSDSCERAIRSGHEDAAALVLTREGRAVLAQLFPGLNGLLPRTKENQLSQADKWLQDRTNQRALLGCGLASFPAQSNDPSCTSEGCNIQSICQVMTDHSQGSPLQRLAKLAAQQRATPGGAQGCEMDWTYTEFSPASTPNASGLSGSGRYWGFQTCNEFGFYQTCEKGSRCFYAQGYTGFSGSAAEHKPNAFCQGAFDISEAATNRPIVESNQFYGALLANASRILWPNGQVDPWSGLSVLEQTREDQPVLVVEGASHHEWTHPSAEGDLASIVAARRTIRAQVSKWLAEA